MRYGLFVTFICWVGLVGILPVHPQDEFGLKVEVVAKLDVPGASGATWSPDGSRLAITAWPNIQIWDTEYWRLLQTIPNAPAYSTKWNPAGNMLAGVRGGNNETVLVWDASTGEVLREMIRPRPFDLGIGAVLVIHDLSWNATGSRIATDSALLSRDFILIWDLEAEEDPQSLVINGPDVSESNFINISELEWSRNGQWLLASGSDGNFPSRSIIRLYDAKSGETIRTIFPAFHPIWSKNDDQFAGLSFINEKYVVNIWDTETGEILSTFEAHQKGTSTMSWNFATNIIAGADFEDNSLMFWDVNTGVTHELEDTQLSAVTSIEWRPYHNQLAIADLDAGVTILSLEFDKSG